MIRISHQTDYFKWNGEFRNTAYFTGGYIYQYAISDGKLHYSSNNDEITTIEDLLEVSPFTKVTE